MDSIKLEKIQAINKYKKHKFLNNDLFLYALIALACSLLIYSPIWYPSLWSSMKVFLYLTLPKIFSHFFSSKVLFIVGNLIVVVLVGESKMFSSDHSSPGFSDVYHDEYVNKSRSIRKFYDQEEGKNELKLLLEKKTEVKNEREEDVDEEEDQEELTLPAEELNKRANDLIARVNKQRRLELEANAYE